MKKIGIVIIIILATGFVFRNDLGSLFKQAAAQQGNGTKNKKQSKSGSNGSTAVEIVEKWDLPAALLEVSGIAYMDADRFACVQDEDGVIFIFNKKTGEIEREIRFADSGDFEGLCLAGNTAYAVRSDGVIFEIDLSTEKSIVYKTYLTSKNNIEGLSFDATNKRLLLAGKGADENYPGYKCIYAFDLDRKALLATPAFKISLSDPLLQSNQIKKNKSLRPSAIAIHPHTLDIFITDGPTSRLLQLSKDGVVKKMYSLGKHFSQPEGITFSPAGNLYISNEGNKKAGNIIELVLPY